MDALNDNLSHSIPQSHIMAVNVTFWSNLRLTLGNFQNNFWLLVPMPMKLCRYTLLILCNVFDTLSGNFSHSTPHYGCDAKTIGFRCTITESRKHSELSIRTFHFIIYGFSCIIQFFPPVLMPCFVLCHSAYCTQSTL